MINQKTILPSSVLVACIVIFPFSICFGWSNLKFDSFSVPEGVYAVGEDIEVTYSVINSGNETSSEFDLLFYASKNKTLVVSNDYKLAYNPDPIHRPGVSSGTTVSYSDVVQFPLGVPTNDYYIIILMEWSGADKVGYDSANLVSLGPTSDFDLRVRDVGETHGGGELNPGDGVTISSVTENLGPEECPGYDISYYLTSDRIVGSGDTLLAGPTTRPALAAETNETILRAVLLPGDVSPGRYYLGVQIEASGDSSAGNNSAVSERIEIVAAPASFSGTVTDADTAEVVTNAVVGWGGHETNTSASGEYTFNSVRAGTHNLAVTAGGYEGYTDLFGIAAGASETEDVQLKPLSAPKPAQCLTRIRAQLARSSTTTELVLLSDT